MVSSYPQANPSPRYVICVPSRQNIFQIPIPTLKHCWRKRSNLRLQIIRLLESAFASQKIESRHFYSCTPSKNSSAGSYHHTQIEENYSFPPESIFFKINFPSQQKGGKLYPPETSQKLWFSDVFMEYRNEFLA